MTPIERAAQAIHAKGGITEGLRPERCGQCRESISDARAALDAALDVDELARVLHGTLWSRTPWLNLTKAEQADIYAQARTIRAHLLGEDQ